MRERKEARKEKNQWLKVKDGEAKRAMKRGR